MYPARRVGLAARWDSAPYRRYGNAALPRDSRPAGRRPNAAVWERSNRGRRSVVAGQGVGRINAKCAGIDFTEGLEGVWVLSMGRDFSSDGGKLLVYLPKWEDRQICLLTF